MNHLNRVAIIRYVRGVLLCAGILMTGNVDAKLIVTARSSTPLLQWRFLRGDATNAAAEKFDDSDWQSITLPHTFNANDGEDGGGYYRGPAWYRSTMLVKRDASRRYYLQFDGAALVTQVWVNGLEVGEHAGGYAAFRFDISAQLHDGSNSIAVRVDNALNHDVAPLGGDFTIFGGLYRKVFLLVTDELHIDPLDHGSPGVYIATPGIDAHHATVHVTTRVRNAGAHAVHAVVRVIIYDRQHRVVKRLQSRVEIAAHSVQPVSQQIVLHDPHLWQGTRDPYLYYADIIIERYTHGTAHITDSLTQSFGIRSIRVNPDRGLLLNGRHYALHGVDYFHSGRPGKGLAVSDANIDEDFRILHQLGATGLRMVHFQHPQHAYDLADRLGLALWTEIPLNSAVDASPQFLANLKQQLIELIRQNYNHPAVVVWGLGNEIYQSNDLSHDILAQLQQLAHREDPSRPTSYAHCCQDDADPQAMQADLNAYNRYYGWYDHELSDIGPWADALHARLPTRAIAISEYGAGASVLQQEDPPTRPTPKSHWHPEQYQALFHEAYWRALRSRSYLWATFVWVGFDLASDGRDEGDRAGINDKGLVTYDRKIRKDAYYWYQANWTRQPMVHITSARDTPRHRSTVNVKVYSNVTRVRLRMNGVAYPPVDVVDHIALWRNVELKPGNNDIEVTTPDNTVRDAVVWNYAAP